MIEKATCTLCAKVESPGFYTGCMIKDGACIDSGWQCDGNGNLTRGGQSMEDAAAGAYRWSCFKHSPMANTSGIREGKS